MLEQMVDGYEQAFADASAEKVKEIVRPEVVKVAMKNALRRRWRHLARERIEDETPSIPLGKRFWPLSQAERSEIRELFEEEKVRRLITSLRSRDNEASVEVLDAAFWVKGCSSLGRHRYAVLLRVGGKKGELCLIDIIQAVQAVAPRYPRVKMPKDNAERVVAGAWHLSPALGDRMLAARFQGRTVFLRELLPQDLRFEIEQLTPGEAIKVARFLATVVGKGHARQMKEDDRRAWQNELSNHRTKTLDAPSWLWSSVVELVVSHEGAYLEHCRRHANGSLSAE